MTPDPGPDPASGAAGDPEVYRAENRQRWERSAAGWERRRDLFQGAMLPVSRWLVEAVHPQPGHRILELAAGPGDTGLLAAELVAPGGAVILSDSAEAMVAVAERRIAALGVNNASARQLDAEWIDLPAAGLDGVICRFGYMLMADPAAALRESRRVLRPGGRLVLATWAAAEDNPFFSIRTRELRRRGLGSPPAPPGAPGPFALSDPEEVTRLLQEAGFTDPAIDHVPLTLRFADLEELWDVSRDLGVEFRRLIHAVGPEIADDLRRALATGHASHTAADGSLAVPGLALVAAADA